MAEFSSFFFKVEHYFIICICICHIFFIHLSAMDTWVVFISWLLCIMLQRTWESRYPFEILISFPWDVYPEVGYIGIVCFLLIPNNHCGCWESPIYFPLGTTMYCPPIQQSWATVCLCLYVIHRSLPVPPVGAPTTVEWGTYCAGASWAGCGGSTSDAS